MGARLLLLLSAYSPLLLIIGVRNHVPWQSWSLLVGGGLLALGLPVVIFAAQRFVQPQLARVTSAREAAGEVSGYLVSFILPFATLSAPDTRDLIAFGFFGVFIFVAYLHSGKLALNPWLFFFRIRVYEVNVGDGPVLVLGHRSPGPGDELQLTRLTRGLFYASGGTS